MPAPMLASMSATPSPSSGAVMRRDWLIKIAALVAALLLLASGMLTLRAFEAIRASGRVDDEMRTAQFLSESFVAALTDAETGQRGYLLTGDPAYLQPYNAAPALIDAAMARMKQVPDRARTAHLTRIADLTRAKLAELHRTVALREAGDADGALAVVLNGSGKKLMDAVRGEVTSMQELGAARLARARQQAAAANVGLWPIGMSAGAILLLAGLTRAWLRDRGAAALNLAARDRFVRAFGLTRGMLRDMDGRITFWGPGMQSQYGYSAEAALGRSSHELLATRFPMPIADIEALLLANGDWQGELSHRAKDGRVTSVMSHWVLLPDEGGKLSVVEMNYDTSAIRRAETYLQLALDAAGLGMWSWDPGSASPLVLDARSKALLLLAPDYTGGSPRHLVRNEDRPVALAAFSRLLDPADPMDADSWEFRPSAEVSQPVWLAASCRAQFVADAAAPSGRVAVRVIGTLRDISASRRAELEHRQTATLLLQTIVETAPGPIYAKDRAGKFMLANAAALALIGRRWPDVEGRRDEDVLGDAEQARMVAANDERIMESGLAEEVEERIGGENGHTRTWLSNKSPLRSANGNVVGLVGVSVEISDRKRAEESQALMIHELNHRVKNTLSTVQAIASETMLDAPCAMRAALEGRLLALSAVHDVLTREAWTGADLHEVVAGALRPFGGAGDRFEVRGPPLPLLPRAALALAMGLHELATNAVKYGALQGASGGVTICWHVSAQDEPRLAMIWEEHGGPEVIVPTARSFGTRMIEGALAWDLGGTATISFEPGSVRCAIDAPLVEVAARPEKVALPRVGRL
jgi:PAS domain S-box-containing protein